jgi:hypothetical protein
MPNATHDRRRLAEAPYILAIVLISVLMTKRQRAFRAGARDDGTITWQIAEAKTKPFRWSKYYASSRPEPSHAGGVVPRCLRILEHAVQGKSHGTRRRGLGQEGSNSFTEVRLAGKQDHDHMTPGLAEASI